MKRFSARSGFTFIEVLVTTAIIAILVSVAVVSYQRTTQAGRDTRRRQDLGSIQAALEFYKLEVGVYPASCSDFCAPTEGDAEWIPGLVPDYISGLPQDPRDDFSQLDVGSSLGQTYNYEYDSVAGTYQLRARLEADGGSVYVVNSPQ